MSNKESEVKKYWDERPCNVRHSSSEFGSRQYFDEVEAKRYLVEPHNPVFACFDKWKDKDVLEIGCGIGTDTINFARAGARVVAIDVSRKSIEVAKKRAEVYGLSDKIRFIEMSAEDMSILIDEKNKFDFIYSFGVIHHTPNPQRVFNQLKSLMKPGCQCRFMLYYRYSWKVLRILLSHGKKRFWKIDEVVAEHSEAEFGCPVTFTYTRDSARKSLGTAGLTIKEMWVDHIFTWSIPEYKTHVYKKTWFWKMIPTFLFDKIKRVLGWHLLIEAQLKDDKY